MAVYLLHSSSNIKKVQKINAYTATTWIVDSNNEHLFSSAVVHKTDFRFEKSASALKSNTKHIFVTILSMSRNLDKRSWCTINATFSMQQLNTFLRALTTSQMWLLQNSIYECGSNQKWNQMIKLFVPKDHVYGCNHLDCEMDKNQVDY